MKLIGKLLALATALLLVNRTISAILFINLDNGVFPTNADSIGIPLSATTQTSKIGAVLALSLIVISFITHAVHKHPDRRPLFLISAALLALSYLLTAAFFALWGLYWLLPDHYAIVASCIIATAVVVWLGVSDYVSLRPDSSSKPTMSPFLYRDLLYAEQRPPLIVRASLTLLPETSRGRRSDSQVHWRPNHNFGPSDGRDFYIGQVELGDVGTIEPGQTHNVVVRFLDGPGLMEQLIPGRSWRIQEGPSLVAMATVIEVVHQT